MHFVSSCLTSEKEKKKYKEVFKVPERLSFWMFLIPCGIWDDELNYSTLRSLKRRRLILIFGWQFGCFERRKIFIETILQMLLICVCHFSCPSTVTPSRRCFETCSVGVISNFRFKGRLFSGVFVSSPSTCILFSSDSVPSDFYNTIQTHHIDFVVNPYVYYLCCH